MSGGGILRVGGWDREGYAVVRAADIYIVRKLQLVVILYIDIWIFCGVNKLSNYFLFG